MSCCITAHRNLLALPVFDYPTHCNQTSGPSFFFTAIVLCILSFLHAHHAATGQGNRSHLAWAGLSCSGWTSDTVSWFLQGQELMAKNLTIAFTIR
jgi:hypothetical protein